MMKQRQKGPIGRLTDLGRAFLSDKNHGIAIVGGALLLFGIFFLQYPPGPPLRNWLASFVGRGPAQGIINVAAAVALVSALLGIGLLGLVAYRLIRNLIVSKSRR
jgi:hypothetical protein